MLTASLDDRTITGLMLPFGEPGRTNLGSVTADEGSIELPLNVADVTLNLEHDSKAPVGRATSIEATPEGLVATFAVLPTRAGDDLLLEVAEGLRPGLSVELARPVVRAGRLLSGLLTACAAVVKPAFPSALLTASDCGDEPAATPVKITKEKTVTQPAAPPANLTASAATGSLTLSDVVQGIANRDQKLIAEAFGSEDAASLFAAQATVTSGGHTANATPVQWLGELWRGKTYERRIVPLVASGVLTSWNLKGFKIDAAPTVANYGGNLAEIPSTAVSTVPFSVSATRLAGGWKTDRKFSDFGDTEFLEALYRGAAEDYARKSDSALLTALIAGSTTVEPEAAPSGVNAGMSRIIDGALSMIEFALPTYALVAPDVYRSILLTRDDDALKYLSSALGLEEGNIDSFRLLPVSGLTAGSVIVGAKEAVTFYELPGVPIRAEAQDISHGGNDHGVFGYTAIVINDARGLVNVEGIGGE